MRLRKFARNIGERHFKERFGKIVRNIQSTILLYVQSYNLERNSKRHFKKLAKMTNTNNEEEERGEE